MRLELLDLRRLPELSEIKIANAREKELVQVYQSHKFLEAILNEFEA